MKSNYTNPWGINFKELSISQPEKNQQLLTPEQEQREVTLEWLSANALYFVLDQKEFTALAVCWSKHEGRERGYTMKYTNLGWDFTPTSCHMDSFLKVKKSDMTLLLDVAVWHCLPMEERVLKCLRNDEWTSWNAIAECFDEHPSDVSHVLDELINSKKVVDNPHKNCQYMLA